MELIFSEEQIPNSVIIEKMKQAGEIGIREEGVDPERTSVSVTFVGAEEIRELNRIYRQKDKVTDVLSFPQFDRISDLPEEGPLCLGDVVICTEQALLQADDFGHSPEREIVYLFVHSLFHLLGYDHMEEDEKEDMRRREEGVMDRIGLVR
ncbi:MAG: rRNA maturation RNase YbeY [Anaerovoracaceae bacterium]|nr:rRNA maturation RNase YbeY [Bacillota bacterium]MDY3954256.1 rRNA maturation RNase YbeY [Anaerovoracaceae bacterium]